MLSLCLTLLLVSPATAEAYGTVPQVSNESHQTSPPPVGELSCVKGLTSQVLQGTIVGRSDTLLTVAHVLDGKAPDPGKRLNGCKFRLFGEDGRPIFETGVRMVSRPNQSLAWSSALDWAILRLEKDAPVEPAQFVDMRSALESAVHSLAYIDRMRGRRHLKIASHCSVRSLRTGSIVLKHDCPSWKGTSGSPLIAHSGIGYRVFGIQAKVGGYAVGLAGWPLDELLKATES